MSEKCSNNPDDVQALVQCNNTQTIRNILFLSAAKNTRVVRMLLTVVMLGKGKTTHRHIIYGVFLLGRGMFGF